MHIRPLIAPVCCCLLSPLCPAEDSGEATELVAQVHVLDELTRTIQREYAEPIARERLWSQALAGMVQALDPASRYLDPTEVALFGSMQAGRGHGFGFDWRQDHDCQCLRVARIIPDSPANAAAIYAGDRITALDGAAVADMGLGAARERLRRSGETISLTVHHPDGSSDQVQLQRAAFTDSGVVPARMLADHIGLLRIARFRGGDGEVDGPTVTAFRQEIEQLREQGLAALILDLRGNGGGSILAATAIADTFLNAGHDEPRLIVRQASRNPARNRRFLARSNTTLPDWPLVVLIDRHTASAAELLAAALKDHRRATLLGEASYGKASIQELFVLEDGSALLLTVAHLHSPAGSFGPDSPLQPHVHLAVDAITRWHLQRRDRLLAAGQELPPELHGLVDPQIAQAQAMLQAVRIHTSR
ncbi:MAG: S41 family peptidase [Planctomycetota bacterium]